MAGARVKGKDSVEKQEAIKMQEGSGLFFCNNSSKVTKVPGEIHLFLLRAVTPVRQLLILDSVFRRSHHVSHCHPEDRTPNMNPWGHSQILFKAYHSFFQF